MKLHRIRSICAAAALGLVPASAAAADIPIPARTHLIQQDPGAGFVARLARLTARPASKAEVFPVPSPGGAGDPTIHGGTLRFCKLADASSWPSVALPAANWRGLGFPPGSRGYRYKGAGTIADPCRSVVVRDRRIKVVCKGPGAFAAPSPYGLPVGSAGAGFELVVGTDRYCAESSPATVALIKKNSAVKGLFKAAKAHAPAACPSLDPTPTPSPTPTPTPPYGSTSKAFVAGPRRLLR